MSNFIVNNAFCRLLKENFLSIQREVSLLPSAGYTVNDYGEGSSDEWKVFPVMIKEQTHPAISSLLPSVINTIAGNNVVNSYISKIEAGSQLPVHNDGLENTKYMRRYHLCLKTVPNKCALIVNGEEFIYREGEAFGFDISDMHTAYNASDEDRVVLIVDILTKGLSFEDLPENMHTELDNTVERYRKILDA